MKNLNKIINEEMPLYSEDICIEKITIDNLLKIKELQKDEELLKVTCRPIVHRSREEYIKNYGKLLDSDNVFIFGIYTKTTKELIGKVEVFDYNPRNRSVEMGYNIINSYRNMGYAKKSIKIIIQLLFNKLNINKIIAQTGSFNNESNMLLRSLRFKLDGRLREHHELNGKLYDDYLYSLLKNDIK